MKKKYINRVVLTLILSAILGAILFITGRNLLSNSIPDLIPLAYSIPVIVILASIYAYNHHLTKNGVEIKEQVTNTFSVFALVSMIPVAILASVPGPSGWDRLGVFLAGVFFSYGWLSSTITVAFWNYKNRDEEVENEENMKKGLKMLTISFTLFIYALVRVIFFW